MITKDELITQIENFYGNLEKPSYKKGNIYSKLHEEFILNISKYMYISDVTDVNTDLCTSINAILLDDVQNIISIYISYVGKYGALVMDNEFIHERKVKYQKFSPIFETLNELDIELVPPELLSMKVDINLIDSDDPKFFNALFVDIDTWP